MKLHLKLVLVLVLFATKGVSQWEYRVNNSNKSIEAVGSVQFNFKIQDTITLSLSKSRKLGLDFSIQANLFQRDQKYYVLLEIADRKIKVKNSLVLNKQLRILELEDLISNEKYEELLYTLADVSRMPMRRFIDSIVSRTASHAAENA